MSPSWLLAVLIAGRASFIVKDGELRIRLRTPLSAETKQATTASKPAILAVLRADPQRCLHCLSRLERHRVATCDACLIHLADRRRVVER